MEEAWSKSGQEVEPELLILKDLDREDFEEIKAYDGDINQMTFTHVKNSKAFDVKDIFDIEDESTFDDGYVKGGESSLFNQHHTLKKSEDGWNLRFKHQLNQQSSTFSSGSGI